MSAVSAPSAPISRDDLRTFQLVVQHVPNMVVIADAERRIQWVNDAYTSITGWTLDEVRGRRPAAFLHGPGTDPEVVARVREALERGEPVAGVEVLNYTKDGRCSAGAPSSTPRAVPCAPAASRRTSPSPSATSSSSATSRRWNSSAAPRRSSSPT
ncbi:PAS domain-containing protein [Schlegelella aquatica]|uniref:PAS domain-containing protein n=1 Tax=Caldimonas aquatica TaxID=376175 RepID=UPI0037532D3D